MTQHSITDDSIKRFAAGTAPPGECRSIVAHLLQGCQPCAERLRQLAGYAPVGEASYDRALDRFEEELRKTQAGPWLDDQAADSLLAELDRLPLLQQEILARNSTRCRSPALCDLLLARSFALRYGDLRRCLQYARLAVLIARRLDDTDAPAPIPAELCIRGFAQLSNAFRISGDLDAANQALDSALCLLAENRISPRVEAMVAEHRGSLRSYQRRFAEAVAAYRRALFLYRDLAEPAVVARALIGQAIATVYSGDPEAALKLIWEALPKIGSGNPRLTLTACHTLVSCELDAGLLEQAMLHWIEIRPLYEKHGDALMRVRESWLEGRLLIAQGLSAVGLRLLETAHRQYLDRDLRYDAAVITLDMAPCYLKLGRQHDVRRLMQQVVPVFQSLGVNRDLLAALTYLERSLAVD
jgi:tetratricopeptide (TPR) repeat protein